MPPLPHRYGSAVAIATPLRQVLSGRDFRALLSVRLLGQFCDGGVQAALGTFVLFSPERQATAAQVAVAFAVLLLPYSLIGPFAGLALDRWRRRQVLLRANLVRAALVLVLALQVGAAHDGLDLAVVVLVTLGVGRFVLAGLSASLPHVVRPDLLVTANALSPTAGTMAVAAGALLGVGVRAAAGGGDRGALVLLVLTAVGYAVTGLLATRLAADQLGPALPRAESAGRSGVRDVVAELVDGVGRLRVRPAAARAIGVVVAHRVAFGAVTVAALLLVRGALDPGQDADAALSDFALVAAGAAAGALLGAVATPRASRRIGPVAWSAATLLVAGAVGTPCLVAAMVLPSLPALICGGAALGFAGQSVKICADTAVQREIADDHLGRVFALYDIAVNVGLVGGITLVAVVAPPDGVAPGVAIAVGALLLATAAWYAVTSRRRATSRTR